MVNYPYPTPQPPHNDGLPFALPPMLKTRTAVSAISVLLGVTSVMGLFRVISVQIKYGMGLDPIGSLMSYSGYFVGILAALLLWVLRPAAEARGAQFPVPGQPGIPFQPPLGAPGAPPQMFPQTAPVQAAPVSPAEITSPLPPITGGSTYNYAQFDDLLGDAEPK
jgi:hypothetical protein